MSLIIMNTAALLSVLALHPIPVIVAAATVPIAVFLLSFVHGVYDGRESPWRQLYALALHLTTAAFVGALAHVVYHIAIGRSPVEPGMPWVALGVMGGGWLLTLLFVQRAVDFALIPSVRSIVGLVLSWIMALAGGAAVDLFVPSLVPGPPWIAPAAVTAGLFLIMRVLFSIGRRARR